MRTRREYQQSFDDRLVDRLERRAGLVRVVERLISGASGKTGDGRMPGGAEPDFSRCAEDVNGFGSEERSVSGTEADDRDCGELRGRHVRIIRSAEELWK